MEVTERIYIYFSDDTNEARTTEHTIKASSHAKFITIISIESEARANAVLKELRDELIEPETVNGEMKPCFLVRDKTVALYPSSSVDTVLQLASRR